MRRVATAALACLAAGPVAIVTPSSASAASDAGAMPAVGFLQVLFALLIVLATIWGFAWFMRRFLPAQSSAAGALKVVGGVMVGPRERLVVVEVGDTWLLLGVAAGHVSLVHSMARPPEGAAGHADGIATASFSRRLQRALRAGGRR